MSEYMDYNELLEKGNKQLKQRISNLVSENYKLKNELINLQMNDYNKNKLKNELFNSYLLHEHQKELISELKIALSSYNNFVDVMFPD